MAQAGADTGNCKRGRYECFDGLDESMFIKIVGLYFQNETCQFNYGVGNMHIAVAKLEMLNYTK